MLAKKSKKKAFTLTELLVIVVVLGVLAAVVLPKYRKVLESRRTTEAEAILGAVRMEQERRCALDKPYVRDLSKLDDLVRTSESSYYTYATLDSGSGASASSKGDLNYQLVMPSYADGRICCRGEACAQLSKDYPLCDSMANIVYDNACLTDVGVIPPAPPASCVAGSSEDRSCEACPGVTGTQHCTCDANTGEWTCGDCFSAECGPACQDEERDCGCQPNIYHGKQYRHCVNGELEPTWSQCNVGPCVGSWAESPSYSTEMTCEQCESIAGSTKACDASDCTLCTQQYYADVTCSFLQCRVNGKGGGDGGKGMVQPPGGGGGFNNMCPTEDNPSATVAWCTSKKTEYNCVSRPSWGPW